MPWKIEFALKFFTALKYFYPSEFWTTCACPEKQSLPRKFSLHWNNDFWGTCACSENRVVPEIFHCIEYSFYIQNFEQLVLALKKKVCPEFTVLNIYIFNHSEFLTTCACPEIFRCIEIFLSFRIFEELALALKTEFVIKFFTVLIYFLHSGYLSNFCLPWKTEFALKIFTALK